MKLPKVSSGIRRFGAEHAIEKNSGIVPMGWLDSKWKATMKKVNWCKARCATQAAAMSAACDVGTAGGGAIACHAVATAWGESCKNDC